MNTSHEMDHYWMPFTANRDFKDSPRIVARAEGMYYFDGLNRVFFVNSGSESGGHSAMKMALAYHRIRGQGHRQLFVSRERAYHGVNMGGVRCRAWSTTAAPTAPACPACTSCATPRCRRTSSPGQPEHGADLADDLQRICALYGGENIAAVFVEPTAGSFGCLPPPQGYLNGCARSATSTASCWCSTRSSPAGAAWAPTSARRPSASRPT
jgi:adenosylmethionine-8-amino-7-oxononanoate aminotransferase